MTEPLDVLLETKHEYLLTVVRQVPADAAEASESVIQSARPDADCRVGVFDEATVQIRDHCSTVIAAGSPLLHTKFADALWTPGAGACAGSCDDHAVMEEQIAIEQRDREPGGFSA